jgi:hypothetical protein
MEVHHSHHLAHKKKLKEYFLEFFMLFLAVSLGFLAENIRESYVEKERAHELALALYADIKNDEEKMRAFIDNRSGILNDVKALIQDIDQNGLKPSDQEQYRLFAETAFYWTYFEPKTANLDQIINSGSLRYFKKRGVIESISKYKSTITNLLARQEREKVFFYSNLQPFIINNINLQPMDTTHITGSVTIRDYFNGLKTNNIQLSDGKKLYIEENRDSIQKVMNMYRFYSVVLTTSYRTYYSKYLGECQNLIKTLELEINH